MRKRSAEEKQKQLERFLMNVAEAADAALWEYWREKEAEHRRFATEYVTRRRSAMLSLLRDKPPARDILRCKTAVFRSLFPPILP